MVVRLAQIDVQLGQHDRALARIDALRAQGKGSPTAEQLAVLTLEEQGKKAEARSRLRAARTQYPRRAPSWPGSTPPCSPRTASPPRPTGSWLSS